jgi:hypothetical protein
MKLWWSTIRRCFGVWLELMGNTATRLVRGTRWCSLLRHCATSRKLAGSIPDVLTGHISTVFTMTLGSTQSLTEISAKNISGEREVKAAGA